MFHFFSFFILYFPFFPVFVFFFFFNYWFHFFGKVTIPSYQAFILIVNTWIEKLVFQYWDYIEINVQDWAVQTLIKFYCELKPNWHLIGADPGFQVRGRTESKFLGYFV